MYYKTECSGNEYVTLPNMKMDFISCFWTTSLAPWWMNMWLYPIWKWTSRVWITCLHPFCKNLRFILIPLNMKKMKQGVIVETVLLDLKNSIEWIFDFTKYESGLQVFESHFPILIAIFANAVLCVSLNQRFFDTSSHFVQANLFHEIHMAQFIKCLLQLGSASTRRARGWLGAFCQNKVGGLWPEIRFAENLFRALPDGNVP